MEVNDAINDEFGIIKVCRICPEISLAAYKIISHERYRQFKFAKFQSLQTYGIYSVEHKIFTCTIHL